MLTPDEILVRNAQIFSLFQNKGWIGGERSRVDLQKSFDNACRLACELDDKQYELYLLMLGNYTKIEFESYLPGILGALNKTNIALDENTLIRAIPLLAPNDEGKNKSGTGLVYFFTHAAWNQSGKYGAFRITGYPSASKLPAKTKKNSKIVTFVLDDFIGTGNTVLNFLEHYNENHLKDNEKIVFLSVAAMNTGVSKVAKLGYEIQADIIIPRGIADCDALNDKDSAYAVMDKIEALIQRSDHYRYGYQASEALITLVRTPNNTFPIFWSSRKTDGSNWPAPFPR